MRCRPRSTHPNSRRLLDFSERPRVDDWSLRAALVRYAQPHPQRVEDLLSVVRRLEHALADHRPRCEHNGTRLWSALEGGAVEPEDAVVVGVLRAAREVDDLGDALPRRGPSTSHGRRPTTRSTG